MCVCVCFNLFKSEKKKTEEIVFVDEMELMDGNLIIRNKKKKDLKNENNNKNNNSNINDNIIVTQKENKNTYRILSKLMQKNITIYI